MDKEYIIIGQGICGSLLAMGLQKKGCNILVIDNNKANSASKVAGGIINPVTGKRLVKSWMHEELLSSALDTYQELSDEWDISLIRQCDILDFHYSVAAKEIFIQKLADEKRYLGVAKKENEWGNYFRFNYGIGHIKPCYLLDIKVLVTSCGEKLMAKNALLEEEFRFDDLSVKDDHVVYKNIIAKKIIFCEGAAAYANPYFDKLPWSKDKGEALVALIPGLPRTNIFKQCINIIPWENDLFWIGASHDWKYTAPGPTENFREMVTNQLDYWLKIPYEVVGHLAASRPANIERKPFVGLHPKHPSVAILNGMGGKGCSMAPYFANQLAENLIEDTPILPEADIKRYGRILSKE